MHSLQGAALSKFQNGHACKCHSKHAQPGPNPALTSGASDRASCTRSFFEASCTSSVGPRGTSKRIASLPREPPNLSSFRVFGHQLMVPRHRGSVAVRPFQTHLHSFIIHANAMRIPSLARALVLTTLYYTSIHVVHINANTGAGTDSSSYVNFIMNVDIENSTNTKGHASIAALLLERIPFVFAILLNINNIQQSHSYRC